MSRSSRYRRAFALALLLILLPLSDAFAHCFVGPRFFPATLIIDDPCVADEMSLPTVSWSKTGDVPPATQWDIGVDIAKRITEDFGIDIGEDWSHIRQPGTPTARDSAGLPTTSAGHGRSRSPGRSAIRFRPVLHRVPGYLHPADPGLRRFAAIQHALPQI